MNDKCFSCNLSNDLVCGKIKQASMVGNGIVVVKWRGSEIWQIGSATGEMAEVVGDMGEVGGAVEGGGERSEDGGKEIMWVPIVLEGGNYWY